MIAFFEFFVLLPLFGFLISLVLPEKNETLLSRWSFVIIGIHMITFKGTRHLILKTWFSIHHPTTNFLSIFILIQSQPFIFLSDPF
jgi:NADH-quinone oxidoreductase subunit L